MKLQHKKKDLSYRLSLVALSVILFSLSMPGSPFPFLVWVVIVPLYLAIVDASPAKVVSLIFLKVIASFFLAIWWFSQALQDFTELNMLAAFVILIILCAILSFPYAIGALLIAYFARLDKVSGAIFAAASMTLVISLFPSAIPGTYAHSLYQHASMIQLLDLGGVPAVVFLILLVNFLIALGLVKFPSSRKESFGLILFAGLLLTLNYLYGQYRINEQNELLATQKFLKVGVVQPMLQREDDLEVLYTLSEELVKKEPGLDLLVWPEFPTRFSYSDNRSDRRKVNQLIAKLGIPMVIVSGYNYAHGVNKNAPNASYRNTAHLIDASRRLRASYSKQILVPFFEYLPFESSIPALRELFPGVLRYTHGTQTSLFNLNDELRIIPLICYETMFSDLSREFVDQGGNFILNLTNDIWQGETHGSAYHMALGMMRSVEYRVPWLRATNSGISAVVASSGEIDSETMTGLMTRDAQIFELQLSPKRSFYAEHPYTFLGLVVLLCVLLLIARRKEYCMKKVCSTSD